MYQLTHHARQRMQERNISAEQAQAALESRFTRPQTGGGMLHYDSASRTVLVIEPTSMTIRTAMRFTKSKVKRVLSR